jgi:hypothetical protein
MSVSQSNSSRSVKRTWLSFVHGERGIGFGVQQSLRFLVMRFTQIELTLGAAGAVRLLRLVAEAESTIVPGRSLRWQRRELVGAGHFDLFQ